MAAFRVRYIATNGIAASYGPQTPTFFDNEDRTGEDQVRELLAKAFNPDNLSAPVYVDEIAILLMGKGEIDVTAHFEPDPAIDKAAFAAAVIAWAAKQ
jgi:hypothetical protein